jgi:hypothetical protein
MKIVEALKKALDPRGPIGDLVSPSIVFKERQGVPVTSPHTTRVILHAPKEAIEHGLAAPQFVSLEDGIGRVPGDRVRMVSAYVEEVWGPVYRRTESADLVEILLASQDQIGWQVTQRESEQSRLARRAHQNAEEFVEVLQSAQFQTNDDWANQYFETIPGNDPVILNGEILRGEATYDDQGRMTHDGIVRGGTMITKGRREYAEKTKNFVTWDKGAWQKHEEAQAEMASRPVRNVRRAMEAVKGECLPMWSPTGINFRRDRRSAV